MANAPEQNGGMSWKEMVSATVSATVNKFLGLTPMPVDQAPQNPAPTPPLLQEQAVNLPYSTNRYQAVSALSMAYGGGKPVGILTGDNPPVTGSTGVTYRMERGYPLIRAGQQVPVNAQFRALFLHAPVNQNALNNGLLDPSQPGFAQRGSTVPTGVTIPFTFAATTTSITVSWPASPIKRMGVVSPTSALNTTVPGFLSSQSNTIPAGSIAVTGLVANTTYFFYGFWHEIAQSVGWVIGGTGSPAIAQTAQSDALLQSQYAVNHVPFNVLKSSTPASGTTNVTGGYGSGNPTITGGGRGYNIY